VVVLQTSQTYITDSLELHLFSARIMKEHALFLKVGFFPVNGGLAREAECLLRGFEQLLGRVIRLSGGVVGSPILRSGELVTRFTERAEGQTQRLTGTMINSELTRQEQELTGQNGGCQLCPSPALGEQVRGINRDALNLLSRFVEFQQQLLRGTNSCTLATANYPLLVEHMLRETRLYRSSVLALEGMEDGDCDELGNNELFWNRIMMEHALFIRGLLDPTQEELIRTANEFAGEYRRLLDASSAAMDRAMNVTQLTTRFRDFKRSGAEGILECRIRSLILPLLADHVLREANRYLRLLER
jgi:hypothetical protein